MPGDMGDITIYFHSVHGAECCEGQTVCLSIERDIEDDPVRIERCQRQRRATATVELECEAAGRGVKRDAFKRAKWRGKSVPVWLREKYKCRR